MPRLPRKVSRHHGHAIVPRLPHDLKVDVTKCHACHAKRSWLCDCATPATWNQGGCHQVPRLPRRSGAASRASRAPKPRPSAPPSTISATPAAKRRWLWVRATPATWYQGGCHQVPRLPRKTTVDVRLCHACHVKSRGMSPSDTPATQKWRGVTGVTGA